MGIKATLLIRIPEREWEALGPNKPAKMREAIQRVTEHPEVLGEVYREAAVRDDTEAGPVKTTTISVAPSHVDIIDKIAKRLSTTRNAIVQMIMKGILAGVI